MQLDLSGQVFGEWTVLEMCPGESGLCLTRCSCGLTKKTYTYHLRHGLSTHCMKCSGKDVSKRRKGSVSKLPLDVIGKTIHNLTVLEEIGSRYEQGTGNRIRMVRCRCACGKICTAPASRIKQGHTKSCGCIRRATPETAIRKLIRTYIGQAKTRKLSFNLTEAQFSSLVTAPCSYCGDPPRPRPIAFDNPKRGTVNLNGIDRSNNERGYEPDNCVACCKRCNFAKGKSSPEEFSAWLDRVALHRATVVAQAA